MSVPSELRCAKQVAQFPCLKRMAICFNSSPAARLKNVRGLLIVKLHLLVPAGTACAVVSIEPHVNGACNQFAGPVLKLVIAPTCTYTFPLKPNSPWFPFVASTVMVMGSVSFGKSGVQVSNCV